MVLHRDGGQGAAMLPIRLLTLSVLYLAAVLGSGSALPQSRQARSEVEPVVVWAQPQAPATGPSDTAGAPSGSDFQSRFGLFAAQSEKDDDPVSVWPGPAWEKNGAPVASDRSGELGTEEDQVASESTRTAQVASYVTQLTERAFSGGDNLAFERPVSRPGQRRHQDRTDADDDDDDEADRSQRGSANRRFDNDDDDGDGEDQDARLSVLRQRRKKLRLNRLNGASGSSRLSVIRRRRPSASKDVAENSEDSVSSASLSDSQVATAESNTEVSKQRRPFGSRRRQPTRRGPQQRRRRPVKKTTASTTTITTVTTTTTRRPVRRRRPTIAAQRTEKPVVTQPTHVSTAQAVYFKPRPDEYPKYPPFAPATPTHAPQQPLQSEPRAPQGTSQPPQQPQQPQQPSEFASSLQQFSDSLRQFSGDQKRGGDHGLSDKVSRLKLKLDEEKRVQDNEVPVASFGKPVVSVSVSHTEDVTTRPLRELFDVLMRAELAKGPQQESYGPVGREEYPEPPKSTSSSLFRDEIKQLKPKLPQPKTDRTPLQLHHSEAQTERAVVSVPPTHRTRPRPRQSPQSARDPSPSDRVVPSKIVYESGFQPITGLSRFEAPSTVPQINTPPSPPRQRQPQPHRPSAQSTFGSKERRPTAVQSRPKVTPPRHRRPDQQQHAQRPVLPPVQPPKSVERKPVSDAGKVRFPGPVKPLKPSSFPSRPRPQEPESRPHREQSSTRPGPAPFATRPINDKPSGDPVPPGAFGGPRPGGEFPPKNRPTGVQTRFPSRPKEGSRPRPTIDQNVLEGPLGGSHQRHPRPPLDGNDRRRPISGHQIQPPRPFGGHQNVVDNGHSPSFTINSPTPPPPLHGTPNRPPPHQKQRRPPPFRTQEVQESSPQPSRVRPLPHGGQPHPSLANRPPTGSLPKGRPLGSAFNQVPSGPQSSKGRPTFSPPPPSRPQNGHFPLKAHPHNGQPPRQTAEESVSQHHPAAPPRGQRPFGSFGQQRPPTGPQRRPAPAHIHGQQEPPSGQQGPPIRHPRPPFDLQQEPSGTDDRRRPPFGVQHRPSDAKDQGRPPFGLQQRPSGSPDQRRPPTGFQLRPPHNPQQRPPHGLQRRPPQGLQQRPPHGLQQKLPQGLQRRPPHGLQQGPLQDIQQRPPHGLQQKPPQGLQQRPLQGLQQRPPHGLQRRPPAGFNQGAPGPAGFGLREPPHLRPGGRLPASAHPRNPAEGPLADLSRRRIDQNPDHLPLLERG